MRLSLLLLRTVRWPVQAGFAAMALAVVVQGRVVDAPAWQFDSRLRLAAALIAVGVGSVVEDDAERTLESSPRYRRWGMAGRLAATALVAAAAWLACVALVPGPVGGLPVGGLAVEAGAWLAAAVAAGLLLGAGVVPASGLVALAVVQFMPQRWTLISSPGSADWQATQLRWAAVAVVGAAMAALALRDPAARVNRRRGLARQAWQPERGAQS